MDQNKIFSCPAQFSKQLFKGESALTAEHVPEDIIESRYKLDYFHLHVFALKDGDVFLISLKFVFFYFSTC